MPTTPTIDKTPGMPWPNATAGLTVQLLPGIHQPVLWSGRPNMAILGGAGVIVEGSIRPNDGGDPATIRVNDGADRFRIIGPLEARNSAGRGIWITAAEDIRLETIDSHSHNIEGILLGDCLRASVVNPYCHHSKPGPNADRRHGLYASGQSSGTTVTGLRAEYVTGSGFQANGHGMGAKMVNLTVEEMDLLNCGSGGTPPISLMSVSKSAFRKFRVRGQTPGWWAVLFSDGGGAPYACYDNDFEEYTASGDVHEEDGSARNTFRPGAGWAPGAPPIVPPIVPPDPPLVWSPDMAALRASAEEVQAALDAHKRLLYPPAVGGR